MSADELLNSGIFQYLTHIAYYSSDRYTAGLTLIKIAVGRVIIPSLIVTTAKSLLKL
jgi:hypothetical protein